MFMITRRSLAVSVHLPKPWSAWDAVLVDPRTGNIPDSLESYDDGYSLLSEGGILRPEPELTGFVGLLFATRFYLCSPCCRSSKAAWVVAE